MLLVLPRGLDATSLKRLGREYVQREVVDRGMVADIAYHDLAGDNPHAHVLNHAAGTRRQQLRGAKESRLERQRVGFGVAQAMGGQGE